MDVSLDSFHGAQRILELHAGNLFSVDFRLLVKCIRIVEIYNDSHHPDRDGAKSEQGPKIRDTVGCEHVGDAPQVIDAHGGAMGVQAAQENSHHGYH